MTNSKTIRIEKALLLLWFVANLIIGVFTVHEYGMSVDEPNNFQYAAVTLAAYPSFFGTLYEPDYSPTFDGHGPAFMTVASIPIRLIERLFPNVFTPDLWHFSYFLTFQLTGLCLYRLTKRWFSQWTAWALLVLFSTQPLLLGHAFINPKDTPFMFLFTLSVVAGFYLVDHVRAGERFVSLEGPVNVLAQKFQAVDPQRKRRFLISIALVLGISLGLFLFSRSINALIEQMVALLYNAKPDSWAGRIFDSAASHSANISTEDYAIKALRLFRRLKRVILIGSLLFSLTYFALLINKTSLAIFLRTLWNQQSTLKEYIINSLRSLRTSLDFNSLKSRFAELRRALLNPQLILAGIALGFATAVRAIAPWGGVIVFLYLFTKVRSKAWITGVAYFLVAGIVTYVAWPRLWGAPIQRYLEGLGILTNFPNYPGRVLFNGQLYSSSDLPRSYLPVLLNIQFTEPFLLGAYVGLCILAWQLLRGRIRADLLLYISLGFAVPLLGLILLNSPLYHNFRQTLFLAPAMFMLAAPALDLVLTKLAQSSLRVLLIAAIALPGLISTIKLYPYEYVYYNSLVGGPAGVRDRYELDYWRISLREAALDLNKLAPQGATVIVTRSAGLFARYARRDLVVDKIINSTVDLNRGIDYIVQVARWQPWDIYPDVKNVISIERDGAVLATAKAVKNAIVK
jgi:hypothetical protein